MKLNPKFFFFFFFFDSLGKEILTLEQTSFSKQIAKNNNTNIIYDKFVFIRTYSSNTDFFIFLKRNQATSQKKKKKFNHI